MSKSWQNQSRWETIWDNVNISMADRDIMLDQVYIDLPQDSQYQILDGTENRRVLDDDQVRHER